MFILSNVPIKKRLRLFEGNKVFSYREGSSRVRDIIIDYYAKRGPGVCEFMELLV